MKTSEILQVVNTMCNRTQFGLNIIACTSIDKDLIRPKHNPYYGRVQKAYIVSNVTFADYANKVNGQANKVGEHEDFVPQGTWFAHKDSTDPLYKVVVNHKVTGAEYLVYCFVRGEVNYDGTTYLLDGRIATPEEVKDIKANMRESKPYENKQQSAVGLQGEKQIDYRTTAIANVVGICFDKASAEEVFNAYLATTQLASEQVPTTRTSGKATA